jgi:hypothetical protein
MSNGNGNGNGFHDPSHNGRGPAILSDMLPPQNEEAEQRLLCAMLLDNTVIPAVLDVVSDDDFYRDVHQLYFRAICDLYLRGSGVDTVMLADELTVRGQYKQLGGDDYLLQIADSAPHAACCLEHADIIRRHSVVRQAIQGSTETIREGYSGLFTDRQIIERATNRIAPLSRDGDHDDLEFLVSLRPYPEPLDEPAWHGIAGRFVRTIEPHTEADPAAILVQFLVAVGNVIGRGPFWVANGTRHRCNLFLCLVGDTSSARKGDSWSAVRWLVERVDPDWARKRVMSGASSGEGLIRAVRDPETGHKKVKSATGQSSFEEVDLDPGEPDKRALFMESEFGGLLTVLSREGNTLSPKFREAWDSGNIQTLTKQPLRATGAHISVIGHVTATELHAKLSTNDAANGFGNRFLWLCARESKDLPHGGRMHTVDFAPFMHELQLVLGFVKFDIDPEVPILRDDEANRLWEQPEAYHRLKRPPPGLYGAIVSRGAPIVMRLACIYAILDRTNWVHREHLEAALAVWKYCEQSAAYVFGEAMGDREADKVTKAILETGGKGITRTQLNRNAFNGRLSPTQMDAMLRKLIRSGVLESPTGGGDTLKASGRKSLVWRLRERAC